MTFDGIEAELLFESSCVDVMTGSGFDLAWISSVSSDRLSIFDAFGAIYIYIYVYI